MYNITDPNIKDNVIRYIKSWVCLQNLIFWAYGKNFQNNYEPNTDIPDIPECTVSNCSMMPHCIQYNPSRGPPKCIPVEQYEVFKKGVIIKDKLFNQNFTFYDYVIMYSDIGIDGKVCIIKVLNMNIEEDVQLYNSLFLQLSSNPNLLSVSYLFIDCTGNLFVLLNSGIIETNLDIIESQLFGWGISEDQDANDLVELTKEKTKLLELKYKKFFDNLLHKIFSFFKQFPNKKIILCGHSHGAVLAHLMNYYLQKSQIINMDNVYVIGSGLYRSLRKTLPQSPNNIKINFLSSLKKIYDPFAFRGNTNRIILSPTFVLSETNPNINDDEIPLTDAHKGINYDSLHHWDSYDHLLKHTFWQIE
jgi:hypothetical protein